MGTGRPRLHQPHTVRVDDVCDVSPVVARAHLGASAGRVMPVLRLCLGLTAGVLYVLPDDHS